MSLEMIEAAGAQEPRLYPNVSPRHSFTGVAPGAPVVFAGRLVESKNVGELLRAWELVKSRTNTRRELWIWGVADGSYAAGILRLVDRVPGAVYKGCYGVGTAEGLRPASIVVVPSVREGASNVVVEALALGKLIVGSDIPGVVELLPRRNGVVIRSPFLRDDIARALTVALEMAEEPEAFSLAAQEARLRFESLYANDIEADVLTRLARVYQ